MNREALIYDLGWKRAGERLDMTGLYRPERHPYPLIRSYFVSPELQSRQHYLMIEPFAHDPL